MNNKFLFVLVSFFVSSGVFCSNGNNLKSRVTEVVTKSIEQTTKEYEDTKKELEDNIKRCKEQEDNKIELKKKLEAAQGPEAEQLKKDIDLADQQITTAKEAKKKTEEKLASIEQKKREEHEFRDKLDSKSFFASFSDYCADFQKWIKENPKKSIGAGLTAVAVLVVSGYYLLSGSDDDAEDLENTDN
jgi:hypothetical protein